MPTIPSSSATENNDIYEKDRPEILAGLFKIVMCWLWQPPRGVSSRALGKREGPDGDKWSKTTQETLGGSEANESERSPLGGCHSPVI